MTEINVEHITKIIVKDKEISQQYLYYPEFTCKKLWGEKIFRKAGFYDIYEQFKDGPVSIEDLLKSHIIIDNIVYCKPCYYVKSLDNDSSYAFYCDTFEEAMNKANEIKALCKNNWLKIE